MLTPRSPRIEPAPALRAPRMRGLQDLSLVRVEKFGFPLHSERPA